jgi:hypothetical protein
MEVGTGESNDNEVADSVNLSAGSQKPCFTAWSSDKGLLEVPPVRPSPAVTSEVEVVSVGPHSLRATQVVLGRRGRNWRRWNHGRCVEVSEAGDEEAAKGQAV